MNIERMLNMILSQVIRRVMNGAFSAGGKAMSRRKDASNQDQHPR